MIGFSWEKAYHSSTHLLFLDLRWEKRLSAVKLGEVAMNPDIIGMRLQFKYSVR